ncbi:MAG: hypothetical protein ACI9MR_000032 [Myxococcota bacterium]|jgi:hypothetical protein
MGRQAQGRGNAAKYDPAPGMIVKVHTGDATRTVIKVDETHVHWITAKSKKPRVTLRSSWVVGVKEQVGTDARTVTVEPVDPRVLTPSSGMVIVEPDGTFRHVHGVQLAGTLGDVQWSRKASGACRSWMAIANWRQYATAQGWQLQGDV